MRAGAIAIWLCSCAISTLAALPCVLCPHATADDAPAANDTAALPRYRFEVGQELVYRLTRHQGFQETGGAVEAVNDAPRDQMEWRVFVVQKNLDGSWRLFVRTKIAFANPDGSVRASRNSLGYCDLHPDGSYSLDEQTAIAKRLIPDELFCRLPDTNAELSQGWSFTSPVTKYAYQFRLLDRTSAGLRMVGAETSLYAQMHDWQITRQYTFDARQALVTSITMSFQREGQLRDRRTIELVSSARRDPAWVEQFDKEAQQYLDANAKWFALGSEAARARTVEACRTARDTARALLVAARERADNGVLRDMYDADLATHDADEKWMMASVKQLQEFFAHAGEFSTTWEAKNFDGSRFRLADQRGKVLVLFFWGSSCEYCVLAAPQIAQLAAEYQGQDVAVLGMFDEKVSADADQARAISLFTAAIPGLSQLEAADVAAVYRLQEFGLGHPSLLILDQAGTVQQVHVGYSSDLARRIRGIVDDLRAKPPVRSK